MTKPPSPAPKVSAHWRTLASQLLAYAGPAVGVDRALVDTMRDLLNDTMPERDDVFEQCLRRLTALTVEASRPAPPQRQPLPAGINGLMQAAVVAMPTMVLMLLRTPRSESSEQFLDGILAGLRDLTPDHPVILQFQSQFAMPALRANNAAALAELRRRDPALALALLGGGYVAIH